MLQEVEKGILTSDRILYIRGIFRVGQVARTKHFIRPP